MAKGTVFYNVEKTVKLFGTEYHLKVQRFRKKVRLRNSVTLKSEGWAERNFTRGYVAEFPDAHWWPEIDFGEKMATCQYAGYEEKNPAFRIVDRIIEAMIFDAKGWAQEESTAAIIERLEKEHP